MTEHDDPGLFQPWRQDERPVWVVTARWATSAVRSDDDIGLLAKTLDRTGMVKAAVLAVDGGDLTVTVRVKATGPEAAELIGVRVVEVAHKVAGLGALGVNVAHRAVQLPAPWRADW